MISVNPNTSPRAGKGIAVVTAYNIWREKTKLKCRFSGPGPNVSTASCVGAVFVCVRFCSRAGLRVHVIDRCAQGNIVSPAVDPSSIDITLQVKMANYPVNISCPIPPFPGTAAIVSISNNNQQFHGALPFTYTLCRSGWVASDYVAPCKPCPAGWMANAVQFASDCEQCKQDHYQPRNASTSCVPCLKYSQTTPQSKRTQRSECLCYAGYYALDVTWDSCLFCPENALCTGAWAAPYPAEGFWRGEQCTSLVECEDQFYVCSPRGSCPGLTSNTCSPGYCGRLCGTCCDGYYHTGKYCEICPGSGGVGYQIFAVVWNCLIIFVIYWKFRYSSRMGAFMILCNFVQVGRERSCLYFR